MPSPADILRACDIFEARMLDYPVISEAKTIIAFARENARPPLMTPATKVSSLATLDLDQRVTDINNGLGALDVELQRLGEALQGGQNNLSARITALMHHLRLTHGDYGRDCATVVPIKDMMPIVVEIDPNRVYLTRDGTTVTQLRRVGRHNFLEGRLCVNDGGIKYWWQPDGRLVAGQDHPEDIMLNSGPTNNEKLFAMGTDQGGAICLERWPEGLVLWYHGSIVWRSWKHDEKRG